LKLILITPSYVAILIEKAMMASQMALGRVGQAEDIGGIVAFLCSEDARSITGQRIEASGGVNL
jgi:NAD(P)-dependent dehydrogenase (short-subunit alcohol dehydrogenase family)